MFHICQNQPFLDGNKRVGANAAITFLLMNDSEPLFEEDELAEVLISVAAAAMDKKALTGIFERRCQPR